MEYALLTKDEQHNLRMNRLRELEIHHYTFTLEELEEPGGSPQRAHSLADLERRISDYRAALGLADNMEGETPERGDVGVPGS